MKVPCQIWLKVQKQLGKNYKKVHLLTWIILSIYYFLLNPWNLKHWVSTLLFEGNVHLKCEKRLVVNSCSLFHRFSKTTDRIFLGRFAVSTLTDWHTMTNAGARKRVYCQPLPLLGFHSPSLFLLLALSQLLCSTKIKSSPQELLICWQTSSFVTLMIFLQCWSPFFDTKMAAFDRKLHCWKRVYLFTLPF